MIEFKDLGIKINKSFEGKSIFIEDVLNKEIVVEHFEIKPSTKKTGTECLHLQIQFEEKPRVIFTGSSVLMNTIKMIKQEQFPFKAQIVKVNRHYEFK